MRIQMSSNALEVRGFVRDLLQDQLPFAVQQAVRQTALDFQEAQRQHQRRVFTVRRATFLDRAVKISEWPTKADPEALVRIDPPGGAQRRSVITDHEEGGTKEPGPGRKRRAVPQEARPSPAQLVPKHLRPKNLGLTKMLESGAQDPGDVGYVQVFRGRHRTFMLRYRNRPGLILQRTGKGTSGTLRGTRVLYFLAPGGVEIRPTLMFHANAVTLVNDRWTWNMARAWDRALGTAR